MFRHFWKLSWHLYLHIFQYLWKPVFKLPLVLQWSLSNGVLYCLRVPKRSLCQIVIWLNSVYSSNKPQQAVHVIHISSAAVLHGWETEDEDYGAAFMLPEVWTDTAFTVHRLYKGSVQKFLCLIWSTDRQWLWTDRTHLTSPCIEQSSARCNIAVPQLAEASFQQEEYNTCCALHCAGNCCCNGYHGLDVQCC